jgi:outer membrane protein assembly factor BamB
VIPAARSRYAAWKQQRFDEVRAAVIEAGGEIRALDTGLEALTPDKANEVDLFGGDESGYTFSVTMARQLRSLLGRLGPITLRLADRPRADGAVDQLAGLANVQALTASDLTDRDVSAIATLPALRAVGIAGYGVTDQGLEKLKGKSQLRCVALARTKVTQQGAAQIEAASPNLAVFLAFSGRPALPVPEEQRLIGEDVDGPDFTNVVFRRDATGQHLWSFHFNTSLDYGRFIWDDEKVYCPLKDSVVALDIATGRKAWESKGISAGLTRVADDLLVAVEDEHTTEDHKHHPGHMLARRVADGSTVFSCELPAMGAVDDGAISGVGDAIMYRSSSDQGRGRTSLFDRKGRQLLFLKEPAYAAIQDHADWVLLMPNGFRRVRSDGSTLWSTPISGVDSTGQLVRCANGDVIGLPGSGEGYDVVRLASTTGALKWRYHFQSRVANHFFYSMDARLELRKGLLAISQIETSTGLQIRVLDAVTGKPLLILENVPEDKYPKIQGSE